MDTPSTGPQFLKGACFARHILTEQLFIPDDEDLSKGLRNVFWNVHPEKLHHPVLFTEMLPL